MSSPEPSIDIPTLRNLVNEDTVSLSLPLQLTTWQKEYKERMGLSADTTTTTTTTHNDTTSDTVLPIHPASLGQEIHRYHKQLAALKTQYIQLQMKHEFLMGILQDPPRQVQPGQVKQVDNKVIHLYRELTILGKEMAKLKTTIAQNNTNNEQARQALFETADTMTQLLDDVEAQQRTLVSLLEESEQYKNKRTRQEAMAILEEQTRTVTDINRAIDAKDDQIVALESHMDQQMQDIQVLERQAAHVHAKAKEAVTMNAQRDIKKEQQAMWYMDMAQYMNGVFGIENVVMEIDLIQVTYTTQDTLTIHVDPVTELITSIEVDNHAIDFSDLEYMAKGQTMKEIGSTLVLETFARTRPPS